jgi:hypothetical protein
VSIHGHEKLILQVYVSYALMEVSILGGGEDEDGNEIEGEAGDPDLARSVFERGYKDLRSRGEKEDVSRKVLPTTEAESHAACSLAGSLEDIRRAKWY